MKPVKKSEYWYNAFWFSVALVLGGVAIWVTKAAFENQWIAALTSGFVVLALMFYYIFNSTDDREEEGDNIYYLGLLFTLLSLIFALIEVFGTGTVIDTTAEQVRILLANFGIALTSTVMGILGRIIVQNFQSTRSLGFLFSDSKEETMTLGSYVDHSSSASESDSQMPLENASTAELERIDRFQLQRIVRELSQGAAALARFHRIVRSHATQTEENLIKHQDNLQRENTEFKDALETNTETYIKNLDNLAKGILDSLKTRHTEILSKFEEFQKLSEDTEKRLLDDAKGRFDSFLTMLQSANNQTIEVLTKDSAIMADQLLVTTNEILPAFAQTSKELSVFANSLESANATGIGFGDVWEEASQKTAKAGREIEDFHQEIRKARNGVNELISSLDSVQDINEKIAASAVLSTSVRAIKDISESVTGVVRVADTARINAENAAETFDAFKESIEASRKEAAMTMETLQALSAAAAQQLENLNNERKRPSFWRKG